MENYLAPLHGIFSLALLALYAVLAVRFFRKKDDGVNLLDRMLAQMARFGLLLVYLTGLYLNVTLGRMVHSAHHLSSLLPIVVVFGIRFWPSIVNKENTPKTYAWMFAILFVLMLIIGVTTRLNVLPSF